MSTLADFLPSSGLLLESIGRFSYRANRVSSFNALITAQHPVLCPSVRNAINMQSATGLADLLPH
eukprot:4625852-Amphidinium_carterae.1